MKFITVGVIREIINREGCWNMCAANTLLGDLTILDKNYKFSVGDIIDVYEVDRTYTIAEKRKEPFIIVENHRADTLV